jgi:hypothetical protein
MKFKTSVLKKVYDIVNELGSDVIFDIKNGIATVKMLNHGKTVYVKIDMFMDSEEEKVFGIQLSDLKKIVNVFKSVNEVEFKFDKRIEIIGGKKKIKIDELARNEVLSIDIDVVSKMSLKMSKSEISEIVDDAQKLSNVEYMTFTKNKILFGGFGVEYEFNVNGEGDDITKSIHDGYIKMIKKCCIDDADILISDENSFIMFSSASDDMMIKLVIAEFITE